VDEQVSLLFPFPTDNFYQKIIGTAEYFSYLGGQKFFGNAEGGYLGKVGSRLKIYS
jgi:hypothetical protein